MHESQYITNLGQNIITQKEKKNLITGAASTCNTYKCVYMFKMTGLVEASGRVQYQWPQPWK